MLTKIKFDMKKNLLFLLLPIVWSCFHHEDPPLLNLTPTETQIVGQWHEVGPKIPSLDSLGNFIDSVDINATYTFNENYTFVADEYPHPQPGIQGSWLFNSLDSAIYFTPTIIDATQTNHIWYIIKFDSTLLQVNHFFDSNLPNDTTTVSFIRKFVKL